MKEVITIFTKTPEGISMENLLHFADDCAIYVGLCVMYDYVIYDCVIYGM